VTEDAIERAIAFAWWSYGEKIEGSAAVALAAVLHETPVERPCVVVLTGGNIQEDVFQAIIARRKVQAKQ
jgi:threonine dehydratase